jgi:hypothetical protein
MLKVAYQNKFVAKALLQVSRHLSLILGTAAVGD